MQRKVILQGPSTAMISLPAKWVKHLGIKRGQYLNVEIEGSKIVVSAAEQKKEKKCTLEFKEEYLDRVLMTKYREGYNEIHMKYENPAILDDIRGTLRYLLGFEIVDQGANFCLIKNISEGNEEDYDTMFRRMFQVILTMSESCLQYVRTSDEKHLKTAIDLRETLVKLEQFNLRVIKDKSQYEFFYVWHISAFGKMWASLAKKELGKASLSKEDITFLEEVVGYNREFYNVFYSRDEKQLVKMKRKLYALRPVGASLLEKSKNKLIIFYLLRMMNWMYEVTQTIAPAVNNLK